MHISYYGLLTLSRQRFHSNLANMTASRSFHGIGPSLSWQASAPVAGNTQDGEIAFDWGLNAALLFGRQKARTHHQTTGALSSTIFHLAAYLPHTFRRRQRPITTARGS